MNRYKRTVIIYEWGVVSEYHNQVYDGLVNLYKGIVIIYDWVAGGGGPFLTRD